MAHKSYELQAHGFNRGVMSLTSNNSGGQRTLRLAMALIESELAAETDHLQKYFKANGGAQFESEIDLSHPNTITINDLNALKHLSMRIPDKYKDRLLQPTFSKGCTDLLEQIDPDLALEDVGPEEMQTTIRDGSPAAQLWNLIRTELKDAPVRVGRQVTASKLTYAKRPLLLPICDSHVRRSLAVTDVTSWTRIWFAVRNPAVRDGLATVRRRVPEAGNLSLIRVLDVLAWKDNGAVRAKVGPAK